MPYFLQHFAKNWVKTLVHGTLHKKLLILRISTRFGGFSPNAILFATFCKKVGENPSALYFAQKLAYFEEIGKFWWVFTKCHTFCNILLKIGSKPQCTVLCTKTCLFRGDRHVLVVFHQMPYFLQHFAKNWVKTLVHGTLHKKLLISRRSTRFGGFDQMPYFFFAKNWVKKTARYFAQKLAYFEEIDTFWWFFTKTCPYCLQDFAKNWVKTLHCTVLCTKKLQNVARSIDTFWWFFTKTCPYFCEHFANFLRSKYYVHVVLCTKKLAKFARSMARFGGFHQMPYFLQDFAKNWVKTLVHGTLHKKLPICKEIDTFWWFFTKCHTFCNILLKIGSKPYCTVLCTKSCLFRGNRHVLVVFHQNLSILFATFC